MVEAPGPQPSPCPLDHRQQRAQPRGGPPAASGRSGSAAWSAGSGASVDDQRHHRRDGRRQHGEGAPDGPDARSRPHRPPSRPRIPQCRRTKASISSAVLVGCLRRSSRRDSGTGSQTSSNPSRPAISGYRSPRSPAATSVAAGGIRKAAAGEECGERGFVQWRRRPAARDMLHLQALDPIVGHAVQVQPRPPGQFRRVGGRVEQAGRLHLRRRTVTLSRHRDTPGMYFRCEIAWALISAEAAMYFFSTDSRAAAVGILVDPQGPLEQGARHLRRRRRDRASRTAR